MSNCCTTKAHASLVLGPWRLARLTGWAVTLYVGQGRHCFAHAQTTEMVGVSVFVHVTALRYRNMLSSYLELLYIVQNQCHWPDRV